WIPSAGFAYKVGKLTTWKGTVSKGFRSPTMRELFMWNPNPELNPETIFSYEMGISKTFFENKMSGELTIYTVNGDNLIINVPMQGYMNSGEVNNKGVEIAINAEPAKNLRLNATYSYINMKNPVFATPKHHLFLNANYRIKKLQLMASIQQVSNLDNDPSPVVNLENYTLLNAKASYNLTRNFKLFISGENLLGTSYQVNRYYTMPKTTVFTGINFIF
ncbi:MAG: TonB-dependent receptor, partial [Draconibacterium sp.]|nr:TonB-dependent receptor [Draconibacterium sp.]